MAGHKVKLFALVDASSSPENIGRCHCKPNEAYSEFRSRLESTHCVEWPFEFYDFEEGCKIKPRMESLDTIGGSVYVIRIQEGGKTNLQRDVDFT